MQLPLAYLDASVIEEVPIDLWRELFEAVGWPDSLASKRGSFGHEDVLGALRQDTLTDLLHQAIETLHSLGTEAGREAIDSVMRDQRVPTDTLPAGIGEREYALRLFLGQRRSASLADVYTRAQAQVQEGGDHRRYNEFLGKAARIVTNLNMKKEALRAEILQHCRESDLGEHVQVDAFEDDGTYVFSIIRSHHTKKPLAVVQGHSARATIEFRPVHVDVLRYEASIGRLRIAARVASMVEFYRGELGKILFDDALFFDGKPVCSLKVLQERGRAALENHRVFGVGRIWMTECLWERGDRNLFHIRSTDCFHSMEESGLSLAGGTFIQAKLKLEIIGKSTRPVTVTVRIPSRIEVSQKTHEVLVDQVLDAIGIRNTASTSPKISLWSLHPWRQNFAVWRAVFGPEMDMLVQSHVLIPVQLDSVPHPEHPDAGRVLEAQQVSGTEFYGVSQAPEIPSRSLSATDLDGLELVPEQLRLFLRTRLGISSGSTPWKGSEVLDLGFIEVDGQRLYAAYALRQPSQDVGDHLRARAGGAPYVILMPTEQTDGSGLPKVMLDSPLPSRSQVIRGAIGACGLENTVSAVHSAPDGARLVVDTQRKTVCVDGIEIKGLTPDSQPFRFIELLARSSSRISTDEITKKLSAGREDGDTTARQAKHGAKRIITQALMASGHALEGDPFPGAGKGFYRCALPSYVR